MKTIQIGFIWVLLRNRLNLIYSKLEDWLNVKTNHDSRLLNITNGLDGWSLKILWRATKQDLKHVWIGSVLQVTQKLDTTSSIRVSADLVNGQIQSDAIIYVQIYNTVYIYMYFCICIIIPWTRWWVPREPQTLDFNLRFLASWFSMHYKNSPWMRALLVYWDIGTVKHALLIATLYVCIRLNTFLKCKFGNYSVFEDFQGQILSLITAIHDISNDHPMQNWSITSRES